MYMYMYLYLYMVGGLYIDRGMVMDMDLDKGIWI
jgi:hypothetical protein